MPLCLRLLSVAAAALAAPPASAALPPYHQRLAELRAVLAHPEVARAFGIDAAIERVEHLRHDLYRVSAGRCHIDVAIVGAATGRRGPRQFEARPGEKVCSGGAR